jgi:DNA-binding response OmpR family regulator
VLILTPTVLVVDDDANICEALKIYLEPEGWVVVTVHDGGAAIKAIRNIRPQLLILDVMLPGETGWDILKQIREISALPVIMLTARSAGYDKVRGLNLGADDYIVKPFDPQELLARVKAVTRRSQPPAVIVFGSLEIDISRYQVKIAGHEVSLAPKELELLHWLASQPNLVFTRQQLLDSVWGYDFGGDTRTVDVHIKRLRTKLDCPHPDWDIRTIWSVGYKFFAQEGN